MTAKRILAIGPLPPPIGGTTCSFDLLVKWLREENYQVEIIDTCYIDRFIFGNPLFKFFHVGILALLKTWRVDVVFFNASDRLYFICGPLVSIICSIFGKRVIFRQFGGEFAESYSRLSKFHKLVVDKFIFKSGHQLFQTKAILEKFRSIARNPLWFPTARDVLPKTPVISDNHECVRCVYVGAVSVEKGVLVTVNAIGDLPGFKFDIYGALVDIDRSQLAFSNIKYHGQVDYLVVPELLGNYDAFVFPSFYRGEGYSGAVIEAALSGLCLVLSKWNAFPEMFDVHECSFVSPRSVSELRLALMTLRDDRRFMYSLSLGSNLRARTYTRSSQMSRLKEIL